MGGCWSYVFLAWFLYHIRHERFQRPSVNSPDVSKSKTALLSLDENEDENDDEPRKNFTQPLQAPAPDILGQRGRTKQSTRARIAQTIITTKRIAIRYYIFC